MDFNNTRYGTIFSSEEELNKSVNKLFKKGTLLDINTIKNSFSVIDSRDAEISLLGYAELEQTEYDVKLISPYIKSGIKCRLTLHKIIESNDGYDAVLETTYKDKINLCFTDSNYYLNKNIYKIGNEYDFELGALVYSCAKPKNDYIEFSKKQTLSFLSKTGSDVEYDEKGEVILTKIHTNNLVSFFNASDDYSDDYSFFSPILSISDFKYNENEFRKIEITIYRENDDLINIPIYVKKEVCYNDLEVGDSLNGNLWLQGKLYGYKSLDCNPSIDYSYPVLDENGEPRLFKHKSTERDGERMTEADLKEFSKEIIYKLYYRSSSFIKDFSDYDNPLYPDFYIKSKLIPAKIIKIYPEGMKSIFDISKRVNTELVKEFAEEFDAEPVLINICFMCMKEGAENEFICGETYAVKVFYKSLRDFSYIKGKDNSSLSVKELCKLYTEARNMNDLSIIAPFMNDEMHYRTAFTFDVMSSKYEYLNFMEIMLGTFNEEDFYSKVEYIPEDDEYCVLNILGKNNFKRWCILKFKEHNGIINNLVLEPLPYSILSEYVDDKANVYGKNGDEFLNAVHSFNFDNFENLTPLMNPLKALSVIDGYEIDGFLVGNIYGRSIKIYCCKKSSNKEYKVNEYENYDDSMYISSVLSQEDATKIPEIWKYINFGHEKMAYWQIFLLHIAEYVMPRYWHCSYGSKTFIFKKSDLINISEIDSSKILDDERLYPAVEIISEKVIRITYSYFNLWEGLILAETVMSIDNNIITFEDNTLETIIEYRSGIVI